MEKVIYLLLLSFILLVACFLLFFFYIPHFQSEEQRDFGQRPEVGFWALTLLLWKLARVGICVVDAQNGVFPGRRLQGSHSPQLKLCPQRDQIREGLNWVILCCAGGGPVVCDVCLCVALISVPMGSAFFECSFGAWCTGLFHSTQPMAQPILQDGNEPHVELGIGSCCQWCQWQGTDWLQD